MPLLSTLHLSNAEVQIWKLTESLDTLVAMLHEGDGERLKKEVQSSFKHERRRREWLLSRILLKSRYGKQCEIDYLPCGKPILKGADGHISISHTADYLALAYSVQGPLGIDIEQWSPRAFRLSERFLFPEETATSEQEATALWSAKEAVFKLFGDAFLAVTEIHLDQKFAPQYYRVFLEKHQDIEIERRDFPDFVLTLATPGHKTTSSQNIF